TDGRRKVTNYKSADRSKRKPITSHETSSESLLTNEPTRHNKQGPSERTPKGTRAVLGLASSKVALQSQFRSAMCEFANLPSAASPELRSLPLLTEVNITLLNLAFAILHFVLAPTGLEPVAAALVAGQSFWYRASLPGVRVAVASS
ncbi:hypothetical protein THAOC_24542, partial [Thalassiosira oceanica]